MIYEEKVKPKNNVENILIIIRVLQTRGLTRFLLFNYNKKAGSNNVFVNAENTSRTELIFKICFNLKLFVNEIICNLYIKKLNKINIEAVEILDRTQYYLNSNNWNLLKGTCIIEDKSLTKFIFKSSIFKTDSKETNRIVDKLGFKILNKNEYIYNELTLDERLTLAQSARSDYLLNVEVWHQRFIVKNDDWIMIDNTTDPSSKFVAGNWQFTYDLRVNDCIAIRFPSKEYVYIKEAILLMGRCDENWFHFLIDTLPRLIVLDQISKEIPMMVRDDLPDHYYQYLKKLTERRIIKISVKTKVVVDKLHFVSARSAVFDSRVNTQVKRVHYSPKILGELVGRLSDVETRESGRIKKKYILAFERNSRYRNVSNWKELLPVLIKNGFTIIDSEQNWFKNQISIFANSKVVIAPGGAIFANIIFMEPGSIVVPLIAGNSIDSKLWSNLAKAFDLQCFPIKSSSNMFMRMFEDINSDFYLDPKIVDKTLGDLMVSIT